MNWTINAYELGAKQLNPNATVTVIFTGSWNDPVKERAAAQALVDQGIDVIGQHVDTPTPQIVAQERGIYGTGHHRDLREFAPKATLCSSAWTWDKHLTPTRKKVFAGNWQPSPYGAFPGIKTAAPISLAAIRPCRRTWSTRQSERPSSPAARCQIFEGHDETGESRGYTSTMPAFDSCSSRCDTEIA